MGQTVSKTITLDQIQKLRDENQIIIHRTTPKGDILVYNLTEFLLMHPAGSDCLRRAAENWRDCKSDYEFHPGPARGIWNDYLIGRLVREEKETTEVKDHESDESD